MRLKLASTSLIAISLAACSSYQSGEVASAAAPATAAPQPAEAMAPAPVADLIEKVSIPYEQFQLPNGLTVLVHTDRKAPVVAISMWYNVGSKHEPKGKTGFAHLFEHLMFNGSENAPGDFFEPLQQIGATDVNGTTWFDRTNYFQTVPTGALDAGLMLESDRMGYLLGAVTQEKLTNQIGVVQNEKRQGDNQPFGLVEYEQLENLYPSGHPYHHSTIGSMDDLSSATLEDVKQWFRDNYGPNNAVLVLAGDIDTATARDKVTKWFGAIPAGRATPKVAAPVPDLPEPKAKTIYDRIATPRVYRMWAIPGLDNREYLPLAMGASVLGGLASSRLDNALVREQQLAVRVSASAEVFAQAGQFVVSADAAPGVDQAVLEDALDAELARFIAEGPTDDELKRSVTVFASGQIRGLERVGGFEGKAPTLAEGLLYQGDPAAYRKTLDQAAAMTAGEVRAASAKWLSRPTFALSVLPGERKEGGEARGGFFAGAGEGGSGPAFFADPAMPMSGPGARLAPEADRSSIPAVGTLAPLHFPAIERATLSNGIKVYFARRDAIPTVSVRLDFNAGYAADPAGKQGATSLLLQLMDEGTHRLDAQQLAIAKERLGINLGAFANADTTAFVLDTPAANLASALSLMADYVQHPGFDPRAMERVRTQQLTRITNELNNPGQIGQRALAKELFGDQHPYGMPPSGTGTPEAVEAMTVQDLRDFHQLWLRPDLAQVFVVGDTSLAEVTRQLEASLGKWQPPAVAAPAKTYDAPIPRPVQKIILIDRPNSPQSVILAGRVLPYKGTDDLLVLDAANEVFGGGFLSRINMNLRESKGWSYGVRSLLPQPIDRASFQMFAPVQADRTGDSIKELRNDLAGFTSTNGVNADELSRLINGNVRELPGRFETGGSVLTGLVNIVTYGRKDEYYEQLAGKYSALTAPQLDAAARKDLLGSDLVFVVVGDAKVVRGQLDALGLPVEERKAAAD